MTARKVSLAFVVMMLLCLGSCSYNDSRITDKTDIKNTAVINKNATQDLDSTIRGIYARADYLAHLEVDIIMKNNKTVEALIEKMKEYPAIIYQDPENLQDPSKEKTAIIVLGGSLSKSAGKYYLLTAGHIRDDDYTIEKIAASFKNGQSGEFELCGYDSKLDAALLKPKDDNFKFNGRLATFGNSANLKVQQTVVCLGSPLLIPNTCSRGAINNLMLQDYTIMHDAKIDAGSSGGPLLNLSGEIVGINVAVRRKLNIWSISVPIDDIKAVMADLKNGVQR